MTGATCCSGIGAPETSMPGIDWRWSAEIEKFPSSVLKARHPGSVNLGDMTAPDFALRPAGRLTCWSPELPARRFLWPVIANLWRTNAAT